MIMSISVPSLLGSTLVKRTLYRQIVNASHRKGGGLVNILIIFPTQAFTDAPYWSPGPEFEICIPNHTWFKDNRDGTVDVVATHVAPKIGIAAWNNSEWTEWEVWRVRVPAGHRWLSTVLWDKPNRITYFLKGGEDEKEGLVPPSQIIKREPHRGHPNEAVLEYWDDFSIKWDFTPRRLEAFPGLGDRYGLLTHLGSGGGSDLSLMMCSPLSTLVYNVTKIARQFDGEIHVLPD